MSVISFYDLFVCLDYFVVMNIFSILVNLWVLRRFLLLLYRFICDKKFVSLLYNLSVFELFWYISLLSFLNVWLFSVYFLYEILLLFSFVLIVFKSFCRNLYIVDFFVFVMKLKFY